MQETDYTLEELVKFFDENASISIEGNIATIELFCRLPEAVHSTSIGMDISIPSYILTNKDNMLMQDLTAVYRYKVRYSEISKFKNVLFLESEQIRYEKFSESIDKEIETQLDTTES